MNNFKPIKEYNGKVVTTKNECLCDQNGTSLGGDFEAQLYEGSAGIWAHTFFTDREQYKGIEYVKAQMPGDPALPYKDNDLNYDHFGHLSLIKDDILDANPTTEEQARVIHSNVWMGHPIGGYEPEVPCTVDANLINDSHFLTPAKIAVKMPSGATGLRFSTKESHPDLSVGTLVQFTTDRDWQSYYQPEGYSKYLGYYDDMKARFNEELTCEVNSCNGCEINITTMLESCDGSTCTFEKKSYTTSYFDPAAIYDGGFGYEMSRCEEVWELVGLNGKFTRDFIYELLCAFKSGDESIAFEENFMNKIIFAKDIYAGGVYYPYVGVVMPKDSNEIRLIKPQLIEGGDIAGFEYSYKISNDNHVRLNFYDLGTFELNDKLCNKYLDPYYVQGSWSPEYWTETKSCLSQAPDVLKFNEFIKPPNEENLLIFVNGYRVRDIVNDKYWFEEGVTEYAPKSNADNDTPSEDVLDFCNDQYEAGTYWDNTGNLFINEINNKNVIYLDGHNKISTSNHKNMLNFGASFFSCSNIPLIRCATCVLNSTPNPDGFFIRYNLGLKTGEMIWNNIQSGKIKIKKDLGQKIKGKIDIVAHSMGYAFAKGVADFLSQKDANGNNLYLSPQNTLGYLYVLAPENAVGQIGSTDPKHVLNVGNFDGVYQYGSDFNTEWKCRQDGVAPQIGINASDPIVNAYIPKYKLTNPYTGKLENIRKFNDAHYVKNFYWVFTEPLEIGEGKVIKRNP